MAKYDFLLQRAMREAEITVLTAEAPTKKSRPTSTDKVLIFTESEKFGLLEGVIFEREINGVEITAENYDIWAVFATNSKLYIIWSYETLKKYFPNCKSI